MELGSDGDHRRGQDQHRDGDEPQEPQRVAKNPPLQPHHDGDIAPEQANPDEVAPNAVPDFPDPVLVG